jgi:hypothetical protein
MGLKHRFRSATLGCQPSSEGLIVVQIRAIWMGGSMVARPETGITLVPRGGNRAPQRPRLEGCRRFVLPQAGSQRCRVRVSASPGSCRSDSLLILGRKVHGRSLY